MPGDIGISSAPGTFSADNLVGCSVEITTGESEVDSPTLPLTLLDRRIEHQGGTLTGAAPTCFFELGPSRVVVGAEAAPDLIVTGGDLGMRVRLRKRD